MIYKMFVYDDIDNVCVFHYNGERLKVFRKRGGDTVVNGAVEVSFFDTWAWLIFVGVGLVLIILELFLGIDTGLDLVFIGTAFVLGGLITLTMNNWVWTAIVAGIICVLYVVIGRRYIHRRVAVNAAKTNIDTIVGKSGIVTQEIGSSKDGTVKVGYEEWRARADEPLKEGEEVIVTGVSGVTLNVKKTTGGTEE
jgi:membrane protein implicated in regulation of membrane protease activity